MRICEYAYYMGQESDEIIVARVDEKLTQSELREFQTAVAPIIQVQGNMRFLVVLDNFKGWEADEGWEDMSFMDANDQYLARFAIVGDQKWRDQILLFTLAGLRSVDIHYFSLDQEQEARMWLAEG